MKPRKEYSEARRERVRILVAEGMPRSVIAERLGISAQSVGRLIHAMGLTVPQYRPSRLPMGIPA